MRKLASIQRIAALLPIPGADKIEVAQIGGWNVVVKKGEFNVGDLGVYFEIDSFLPAAHPAFAFLAKDARERDGVQRIRLKTDWAKLGKIIPTVAEDGVYVLNAITQQSYGREPGKRYVSYDAVADAFALVRDWAIHMKLPVNFPLLGAGLGGGDWEIISTIIDRTLGDDIEKILWVQK